MKFHSAMADAPPSALRWIRHVGFPLLLIAYGCGTDANGRRPAPLDMSSVRTIYQTESPCRDCIRLEQIAKMGEREGPGFLTGPMYATRDHLGRFWVEAAGSVKVFNQHGAFLHEVGRSGQGPNEFGRAWPMFTDNQGRVHVFDVSNARISLFDSQFSLVEERRLPGFVGKAYLPARPSDAF